jgi:hypothetical protein
MSTRKVFYLSFLCFLLFGDTFISFFKDKRDMGGLVNGEGWLSREMGG